MKTSQTTKRLFVDVDRYSGTYSHAKYTAWLGSPPKRIRGDDAQCFEFWRHAGEGSGHRLHGKGATKFEAVKDLQQKIARPYR